MITIQQLTQIEDYGISYALLKVLLVTSTGQRIDDVCQLTGVHRRTLEKMIKRKPTLLKKYYEREPETGLEGAPRTKILVRTEHATKLLKQVFE